MNFMFRFGSHLQDNIKKPKVFQAFQIRNTELYLVNSIQKRLGAVAHICNPNCLGGREWEDLSLRPIWAKH
jgi:hypothetical protein